MQSINWRVAYCEIYNKNKLDRDIKYFFVNAIDKQEAISKAKDEICKYHRYEILDCRWANKEERLFLRYLSPIKDAKEFGEQTVIIPQDIIDVMPEEIIVAGKGSIRRIKP